MPSRGSRWNPSLPTMTTTRKSRRLARHDLAERFITGLFGGRDWSALRALLRDGLERGAFDASTVTRFLASCVRDESIRPALRRLIVRDRSWKRRVADGSPLAAAELERMTAVGEVVREVRRLYGGDVAAAEQFLTLPHKRLGSQPPILVAATEGGAQAVRELLGRMEEGAPA
jgi:putative toxin-antitoxin system antitoxin component (TIGR02293 family)